MKGRKTGIALTAGIILFFVASCGDASEEMRRNDPAESVNFAAAVKADEDSENSYEYRIQELYAERDGKRLYGVVYIPEHAGEEMPAVIFSHGYAGNYQVGVPYAEALARQGYVTYCFDFSGGSPGSRSDGSTLEMSVFTEQADLEAVIHMMQEQEFVDAEQIFLAGTSQGGAVSAITAAENRNEIQGLILFYPAFMIPERMRELFPTKADIPDTYHYLWMNVGKMYAESVLDYDIFDAIASYDRDVLILHGDADVVVPHSYAEKALLVYPSARLEVFPGAGHGFYGEDEAKAIQYMKEYLDSHKK